MYTLFSNLLRRCFLLFLIISGWAPVWGQESLSVRPSYNDTLPKVNLNAVPVDLYNINIRRATSPITLDGKLDEAAWQAADSAFNFYQNYPYDTGYAQSKTVFWVTYDDKYIWFAAKCYDPSAGKAIAQSLNRDWSVNNTDGVQWIIDPFDDKTNGFGFGVSPYNAQREGLIAAGQFGVGTAWDNKWYSATHQAEGYWTMEAAIPYNILRYKSGNPNWRLNFNRMDFKRNEKSTWVPMYRNFSIASLAYTGKATWDEAPIKRGNNISLIPYLAGRHERDNFASPERRTNNAFDLGLDAKIGLSSSMNLDLTVNPDFSQVEVDRQVTNLSRFELFFPERRNFFLENADLFDQYGTSQVRPFFSRRIGIVFDPNLRLFVPNPILLGARASGKLDKNWRIGALSMQTPEKGSINLPSNNYSMLAVQRMVFSRSFVSGFLVNRQSSLADYNRVGGLEYTLASKDGKWFGHYFLHNTWTDGQGSRDQTYAHGSSLSYNNRNWYVGYSHSFIGEDYRAEVGFVPRRGTLRLNNNVSYTFTPKSDWLASHGPSVALETFSNNGLGLVDRNLTFSYSFQHASSAYGSISHDRFFLYLFSPFDPTNSDKETLRAGSTYTGGVTSATFHSNLRSPFFYTIGGSLGDYYVGRTMGSNGNLNYRFTPYGTLTLDYSYTHLEMPQPWNQVDYWIVGPGMNLTFTTALFLRMNVQYNNQIDNVNFNARFQWRFQPASDFFLVYTDNYVPTSFRTKNRALVAKLTWWLNA